MPLQIYTWSMARPITIQLYLPDGNPRGLRISELTTSVVRVIEVPRTHLGAFQKLPESRQVGLYFLFGGDKSASGHVYIGQTSNVGARLATHNSRKDFWTTAWVVVFNSPHFTPTHTLYMEYESIRMAQEAQRFTLDNGNAGQKPPISYGLQSDADNALDTIRLLFDALQFPVFEPRASLLALLANNDMYFCSSMGMQVRGHYTAQGFMVLTGSTAVLKTAMFIQGTNIEKLREQLYASKILRLQAGRLVFAQDHEFASVQEASAVVLGRHSNVENEWFDEEGRALRSRTNPRSLAA